MMYPMPKKPAAITTCERVGNSLILKSERGVHRIAPISDSIARISYTVLPEFSCRVKPGVTVTADYSDWSYTENDAEIRYISKNLVISIDRHTASLCYYDGAGKLLLREASKNSKSLEKFDSYIICEDKNLVTRKIQTADGEKEVVASGGRILDGSYFRTRQDFEFCEGEVLYGFGQQEEGTLNLRGRRIYLHQANRKIQIPFMLSTNGYGILFDYYCPMIFNDNEFGSYVYSAASDEIDYYFISGGTPDGAIRGYRTLTGKAAMLPSWAYGYVQCRERYESAEHLLTVAKEFKRKGIPLDTIVLDWLSWPDGLWGQKTFDPSRFPDPKALCDELHDMNVHLMMSIWPNADQRSSDYAEFKREGCLLPASNIYDAFSEKGRKVYWKQVSRSLYCHGVDAWWCDSSEPYTTEWNHMFSPEPSENFTEYQNEASAHIPAWETSAYGLFHAKGLYNGMRGESNKRVLNLTRSGYSGSQRYGTVLWSGDISASWKTFRNQITQSLNFSASGLPYWTVDIGAFFVKEGNPHYWSGEYNDTTADAGYRELYTRWFQWGAFLPMFRVHGTDCSREPWQFDDDSHIFYNAILSAINLRYKLMPYIYSLAGRAWLYDDSIIKPLAFSFPWDDKAHIISDQYMFGDLMICPVTEPMYFTHNSTPVVGNEKTRSVYLPAGCDWFDFHTNKKYCGGQTVEAAADIDTLPIFVRAGAIIPTAEPCGHVDLSQPIEYLVYSGADGEFTLYRDDGLTYSYESGDYTLTTLTWCDTSRTLTADSDIEIKYTVIE